VKAIDPTLHPLCCDESYYCETRDTGTTPAGLLLCCEFLLVVGLQLRLILRWTRGHPILFSTRALSANPILRVMLHVNNCYCIGSVGFSTIVTTGMKYT